MSSIWNRNYVASVQITMAEDFGIKGRGAFYETAGCLRDVIENHLFQIVALLAMEPPATRNYGSVQVEKAKVFEAMRPLTSDDLVRGQYAGYRREDDVARNSDVETFCALRLFIDSWRWAGVPFYLRSGKYMPVTATGGSGRAGSPRRSGCSRIPTPRKAAPTICASVVRHRRHRAGRAREEAPGQGVRR